MEVHLVADTNLFFECRSLEDLPWSELGYDPIVILLTKPVLDEIDKHKKGTGRTRSRALEIFGRVRGMLTSSTQEVEIQTLSPKVVLRRMPNVAPDAAHKGHLDYAKTDERLIGIVSTLAAQASGYDVKLFTDDTGPASTADGMGVPYLMINQSWRRPAAETTEEKRIKDLEKDLATYRAQEPKITIGRCEPADESNVVTVIRKVATPLTEGEVEGFLAKLRLKCPLVTDFTTPPPSITTDSFGTTTTTGYSAPAEADITNYRDVLYPQWLERCRTILKELHQGRDVLEPDILLRWPLANQGSRPASQVRIVFEARGPLALWRPTSDSENEETEAEGDDAPPHAPVDALPHFPPVPTPPAFPKQVTRVEAPAARKPAPGFDLSSLKAADAFGDHSKRLIEASRTFDLAARLDPMSRYRGLNAAVEAARLLPTHSILDSFRAGSSLDPLVHGTIMPVLSSIHLPHIPKRRDPEGFYYDWPASQAVTKGALTCDLWRHQTEEKIFEFEVKFTKAGEAGGTVECIVHAENITRPEQARAIIRRTIEGGFKFERKHHLTTLERMVRWQEIAYD
jgi:hypothetical protein